MKAAKCRSILVLLCVLALVACGPSQEELDATATQEAANAAATQTAAAATATPRPTDTPTPRPTDTPTPTPPAPEALMVDAQAAMSQLESFHMEMDMATSVSQEGVSMEMPIIFAADIDQSGNMQGTMSISILGMTLEIEMISLDGVTYTSDPTTGQWSIVSEDAAPIPFDPETLVVPEAGGSSLEELNLVGQETLGGVDVYHLQITLPADAFAAGAGEGVDVTDMPAEIWIGAADGLIYQLTFSGTLPIAGLEELAAGGSEMTMDVIITFSNFNDPLEIVAPEVAAPPEVMLGVQGTQAVAYSPNGLGLATGGDDAIVRVWHLDYPDSRPAELTGPTDVIRALAFSPDGRLLAAAGDDQLVWLWDVVTAEVVQLAGHTDWIRALAFSPDGDILASAGDDTTILLWDMADLQAEPQQLEGHGDYVRTLVFSPDGATLASGGDDQMVLLWDMNDLAAPPVELAGHEDWVRALAFSPDGGTLASGSDDTLIYLWDVGDPAARPRALEGHTDYVNALAYSPDGGTLASGDDGGALLLWDLNDLTAAPRELADHSGAIAALAFSPDGRTLASAGSESVLLWDLTADEPTSTTITPPTFTPKSILVDASRDGGAWWYPQGDTFNPDEPHQGKALADYLRTLGYSVTELPRPTTITSHLLAPFDFVIRANEYEPYTSSEIAAYHGYLETGGKLLLLSDYKRPNEQDSLGLSFGILFQGISGGENVVDTFEPHPITEGVLPLPYMGGSGISKFPEAADILGYLSTETYLDLNDNGMQDPDEPTQAPALGEMAFGNGKIVFCGDTNMWLQVPRPLIDNAVNWLISEPSSAETSANTWYVKPSASGTGDCSSWANSCGLQSALLAAMAGDEIWVAAGIYTPAADTRHPEATIPLKRGVALYGGFAGTETARDQRNWEANFTVLSGDLGGDDITDPNGVVTDTANIVGQNAYHVVTGSGVDTTAILDGFVITAGYASQTPPNIYGFGGGMFNQAGSPTLNNLVFSGNTAGKGAAYYGGGGMFNSFASNPVLTHVTFVANTAGGGAGMYNDRSSPVLNDVVFSANKAIDNGGMNNYQDSSPTLEDVTFSGNVATRNAGGMGNYSNSNPILSRVTFVDNSAGDYGGGMGNFQSSPTLTDVEFSNNQSQREGGGMHNASFSRPVLTNVTFADNSAAANGGGMLNSESSPTLTNVTFADNSAGEYGGGLCNTFSSRPTLTNATFAGNRAPHGSGICNVGGSFTLVNGIVWGNIPAQEQIYNDNVTPDITYSDIEGGFRGARNLNVNPRFDVFGYYDSPTRTFGLLTGSPVIDRGSPSVCPATDQLGVPRPVDGDGNGSAICDMGAVEFRPPD